MRTAVPWPSPRRPHGMPITSLPPELWLIVLDFAKRQILIQCEYYNHTNFSTFYHQLRDPRNNSPINRSCKRLRQVCKMFKAFIGASPHYQMLYHHSYIQPNAQAVTIVPYYTSHMCLQSLLEEKSIALNVVSLHLPRGISKTPGRSADFDLLCLNAIHLPSIRSLNLHLYDITAQSNVSRFWSRLNTAFPLLASLAVVTWECQDGRVAHFTDNDDSITIFKHLRILVVDNICLHRTIQLPVVRHVSLAYASELRGLLHSPRLESLLFRGQAHHIGTNINVTQLSPLQSLGIPFAGAATLLPLPKGYPLVHLCIFFISPSLKKIWPGLFYSLQDLVPWITQLLDYIPSISRITLDTSMTSWNDQSRVETAVSTGNFSSIGLVVPSIAREKTSIVLERDPFFRPVSKKISKRKWGFGLF